ncbi:MAG TPA: glycine-rich protein, partial [Chitinophagales bacterium]|nr:glycine-rich protein [Chitinophagales bacterium]
YSTLCHTPVDFAFTSLNGCAEGAGATLELAGSEINYNYQLEKDGSAIGSPVAGSGEALQFTGLTNPGIYTVAATSLTGNCTAVMTVSNPVVSGELPDISQLTVETCFGQTVNLSATTSVGSINWYDAEIGGNLLGNSASGEDFPVSPATTTTYYAQINAVPSGTQIFQFTGASQTFVVPAGVTSITVTAKGAGGSDGYYEDGPPGEGGIVTTDLAVTPGQALNIYVGGLPTGDYEEIGGYNGGGSSLAQYYGAGGGATDIRINGTALANRVIVAGGGGGAGYDGTGGGNGGGLVGEAGDDDTNYPDEAKGGGGGTQSASGAGGFGNGGSGYPGTLGQGGDGADYDYYGAGGGGGYYGGGGGGENASGGYVGGGGGGSSYTDLTLCTNTQHTQGGNPGNGIVILNWGSGGCPSPIRVPVVVNTGPAITTTNITACGSYTWAITGQTYTQPGTYTVTVSDCDIQTLNLTIPPGQVISLNGATTVCVGGTIGLVATGGNQYQWSGPNGFSAVGGSITRSSATTAMSGVYTVTITNNSCQNVLSTTVTVYPIPSATISGATAVCSGGTISLSAPAGAASYAWSGPGGFTASTQTITRPNATTAFAGNYTVTVTGAGGCTATASRSVSVSSPTAATITGATSFCSNNAITLTATTAGVSYQWSGPGGFSFSGATMTRTPAVAGTYIVTVTTAAGCTSSGSRSVTVTASPNATITNNSTCSRIWLLASGGNSYAWSGPNGFNTTGTTVLRNNPTTNMWGTYSVTITSNGCTATASVTVSPCGAGKNAGEEIVQNMAVYPNPTGSISNISFYSQIEEPVTLKVFAADGKEIALLFNQTTQPDTAYNLVFDATQLSNGTY